MVREFVTARLSEPDTVMMKDQLVDRQLDVIEGFVTDIKGDIGRREGADVSILVNYLDKIKSLEGKLEGLVNRILSLEEYKGRLDRASEIECTLFNTR